MKDIVNCKLVIANCKYLKTNIRKAKYLQFDLYNFKFTIYYSKGHLLMVNGEIFSQRIISSLLYISPSSNPHIPKSSNPHIVKSSYLQILTLRCFDRLNHLRAHLHILTSSNLPLSPSLLLFFSIYLQNPPNNRRKARNHELNGYHHYNQSHEFHHDLVSGFSNNFYKLSAANHCNIGKNQCCGNGSN